VAQIYSPGTGFPFRRLLRLVGLRWRYSDPPPQRIFTLCKAVARIFSCTIDLDRFTLETNSIFDRQTTEQSNLTNQGSHVREHNLFMFWDSSERPLFLDYMST
jgi:hypothetical protein